ncbi:PREDICTED: uncharacterized protein LOC105456215 [Wasmannia auropunctata]|uniref:uncharacterized protein LOC105456215 n=1 Tax=Wasmannia auropunctata TaxID=64793 RepID=UPI0005EF4351|nr:PREDICTED: uncharacterized protein LOC105456215 [Wasmannia auropunctata]
MTKITIISCIIAAVCVFQTAEARLFEKQDLGSLLGNAQNGMSGALENMKEMGDKLQNHGKEMMEGIKNGLEKSPKRAFGPSKACVNVFEEGQKGVEKLIQSFDTCVLNVTGSHSADVDNVIGAINDLQMNLLTTCGDFLKCTQNPFKVVKCFTNNLRPQVEMRLIEDVLCLYRYFTYMRILVVGRLLRGRRIRSTTREAANFPGWNTYGFWA